MRDKSLHGVKTHRYKAKYFARILCCRPSQHSCGSGILDDPLSVSLFVRPYALNNFKIFGRNLINSLTFYLDRKNDVEMHQEISMS